MKKLIAVLSLIAVIAAGTTTAQADVPLLYRTKFRPSTGCFARGWLTDQGVTTDVPNNPTFTYIIFPGDELDLMQSGTCCGDNQQHAMGYTWIEVSSDYGWHWSLVSPSFHALQIPENTIEESYALDNTGTLQPQHHILNCNGTTGP